MREGPAPEVQKLQHLVEAGRVAGPRGDDREDALYVARQEVALQQGFPGPHPVAVALQRVDLAVVGDVPVGVGEGPAREGVGGEAAVDQRQGGVHPLVAQVDEEGAHLRGRQHPLVDDGAGRQRGEVDTLHLVLDALAQHERAPLQLDALESADEHLVELRHGVAGHGAQLRRVHGQLPPPEQD